MSLSKEQKAAFDINLEKWTKNNECLICGNVKWAVQDDIFMLSNLKATRIYPVVCIVCGECGYSHMFSAVIAGIKSDFKHNTNDD